MRERQRWRWRTQNSLSVEVQWYCAKLQQTYGRLFKMLPLLFEALSTSKHLPAGGCSGCAQWSVWQQATYPLASFPPYLLPFFPPPQIFTHICIFLFCIYLQLPTGRVFSICQRHNRQVHKAMSATSCLLKIHRYLCTNLHMT